MGLFGSKPKITYVFVFYHSVAPTKEQQDQIVSSLAKGRKLMTPRSASHSREPAIAFTKAYSVDDEHWFQAAPAREAYFNALCAMYFAKEGLGGSGEGEGFKMLAETKNFVLATVSENPIK